MYDLANFRLSDLIHCGSAIRRLHSGAGSQEEAAGRIVRYLYDSLEIGGTGQKACALVRCFKSCHYSELDSDLQAFTRRQFGAAASSPEQLCLALLATAGDRSEWNLRKHSSKHRVLLLGPNDPDATPSLPWQIVREMGLDAQGLLHPEPDELATLEQRSYGVFHIFDAAGSPYIPDQDEFVEAAGVRSVIGIGGMLSSGSIFQLMLFTKVPVHRDTAELFRTLALNMKVAFLSLAGQPTFAR